MTPETKIKTEIRSWLVINHWFQFPILQGMGAHKGISDLIACRNGIVLFIEVKTPKGKLSEHQMVFRDNIQFANCHYVIARGYEDIENYLLTKDIK